MDAGLLAITNRNINNINTRTLNGISLQVRSRSYSHSHSSGTPQNSAEGSDATAAHGDNNLLLGGYHAQHYQDLLDLSPNMVEASHIEAQQEITYMMSGLAGVGRDRGGGGRGVDAGTPASSGISFCFSACASPLEYGDNKHYK